MNTLLFPLYGNLSAFGGEDSQFNHRNTRREPTKGSVVGLIANAFGMKRVDDTSHLSTLPMGVRIDRPHSSIMVDYHTAMNIPLSSGRGRTGEVARRYEIVEGKIRAKKYELVGKKSDYEKTVLSHRSYLCDAAFLVGLESEDEALLEGIEWALRHPVRVLYLGRRSCSLSIPAHLPDGGIRRGVGLDQALMEEPSLEPILPEISRGRNWFSKLPMEFVFEKTPRLPSDLPVFLEERVRDVPMGSRKFSKRKIVRVMLPRKNGV